MWWVELKTAPWRLHRGHHRMRYTQIFHYMELAQMLPWHRLSMTPYRVCPVPHSRWTQRWQLLHSRACCCAVMTLKCTLQSPLRAETFIVNNSKIHHGILTLCLYRLLLLGLVHCGILRRCWAFITHWMQLSATFYWTFLFSASNTLPCNCSWFQRAFALIFPLTQCTIICCS